MPKHRQPRELAELTGAARRNPQRYRNEIPRSEYPAGEAPEHMSESAKAAWFELTEYAPAGVLTGADRFALEVLATLLAEYRNAPDDFPVGKFTSMLRCLGMLGMSPADRQNLGATKRTEPNPFDEF